MRFNVGCELAYDVGAETTLVFNVAPTRDAVQTIVSETLTLSPDVEAEEKTAENGNRYLRVIAPKGPLTLRYEAEVTLRPDLCDPETIPEVPVAALPLETMAFLNPSRYCPSDELSRFAARRFGDVPTGFGRVTEICNWINDQVDYTFGVSDTTTTAVHTFAQRAGVCRDFAHLGITLCRALGIPARFVSCYAWQLVPQDFHAVFEAYLGDRWYLFDATRMAALDGLVRIGCGRDAADTAFATLYGQALGTGMTIWSETRDGDPSKDWTTDAVSVSRR